MLNVQFRVVKIGWFFLVRFWLVLNSAPAGHLLPCQALLLRIITAKAYFKAIIFLNGRGSDD